MNTIKNENIVQYQMICFLYISAAMEELSASMEKIAAALDEIVVGSQAILNQTLAFL